MQDDLILDHPSLERYNYFVGRAIEVAEVNFANTGKSQTYATLALAEATILGKREA